MCYLLNILYVLSIDLKENDANTDLTVFDMLDGRVQQRPGLHHQQTLLHPPQVLHGEQGRLLHQVSRELVKLGHRPETHTHTHTHRRVSPFCHNRSAKHDHSIKCPRKPFAELTGKTLSHRSPQHDSPYIIAPLMLNFLLISFTICMC